MSESFDPDLEGAYEPQAVACHACAARDAGVKQHRDVPGVKVGVSLIEEAAEFLRER